MRALTRLLCLPALCIPLVASCSSNSKVQMPPPGSAQADLFLFERGNEELARKRWYTAREYFRDVIDRYPQSAVRPDAKLALGDTYLAENTAESRVLAINEYQEFLSFFPTHERADYAQFKIAYAHYKQMPAPQRDQTETREAAAQFETFLERFPHSGLKPEAEKYYRDARDRLSQSEFEVALFYVRAKWCPGAIGHLDQLLATDPQFTRRDGVYFYLAECSLASRRITQAAAYYDRLLAEFPKSEYRGRASKRLIALK